MKIATFLALFLASATAFNAPQFATRAVGKPAAKKAGFSFGKKAAAPAKVSTRKRCLRCQCYRRGSFGLWNRVDWIWFRSALTEGPTG